MRCERGSSLSVSTRSPSLYHSMVGVGRPSALQLRVAGSPLDTIRSEGSSAIRGGLSSNRTRDPEDKDTRCRLCLIALCLEASSRLKVKRPLFPAATTTTFSDALGRFALPRTSTGCVIPCDTICVSQGCLRRWADCWRRAEAESSGRDMHLRGPRETEQRRSPLPGGPSLPQLGSERKCRSKSRGKLLEQDQMSGEACYIRKNE